MGILVLSEVSKKQQYIFKSNKLRENVGASLIIRHVTETMPIQYLGKYEGESLLQGGGKGLYYFESKDEATPFVKSLSTDILKKYPELEMFFVTLEADLEKDNIVEKIGAIYKKLGQKKSERKVCSYQVSFGKEVICSSTGMPAVGKEHDVFISPETKAKLLAQQELEEDFLQALGLESVVKEFDTLSQEGQKSYLAIVHIDGNKMGVKFDAIKNKYEKKAYTSLLEHNKNYLKEVNELSESIDRDYKKAFKKMYEKDKIRPLILAGDDVCFVCHAQDAIRLSNNFLDALTSINKELHACAGIAIIKAHYPFSSAYQLSEELCQNCKNTIVKMEIEDTNMIDWHIVTSNSAVGGSIEEIRRQYYTIEHSRLMLRPLVAATTQDKKINSYDNFKLLFEEMLQALESKKLARSKLKKLREVYLEGEKSVEIFIKVNGIEVQGSYQNPLDYAGEFKVSYGFYKEEKTTTSIAMYFDAIELMDLVDKL